MPRRNTQSHGEKICDASFEMTLEGMGPEALPEVRLQIKVSWSKEEWGTECEQELHQITDVLFEDTNQVISYASLDPRIKTQVEAAVAAFVPKWQDDSSDEPDEPEPTEEELWERRERLRR